MELQGNVELLGDIATGYEKHCDESSDTIGGKSYGSIIYKMQHHLELKYIREQELDKDLNNGFTTNNKAHTDLTEDYSYLIWP